MRHRKSGIKLNRTSTHRNAMFRNMVTSLFKYDRIRTTDAKAKELRRWADNLITLAKRGDLHARRQALSIIREKNVVHKLFDNANEKYGQRTGGYTRIVKLGKRPGDAADISIIELIISDTVEKKKKAKPKAEKKKAAETKSEAVEAKEETSEVKVEAVVEAAEAEPIEVMAESAGDTAEEAEKKEEKE